MEEEVGRRGERGGGGWRDGAGRFSTGSATTSGPAMFIVTIQIHKYQTAFVKKNLKKD